MSASPSTGLLPLEQNDLTWARWDKREQSAVYPEMPSGCQGGSLKNAITTAMVVIVAKFTRGEETVVEAVRGYLSWATVLTFLEGLCRASDTGCWHYVAMPSLTRIPVNDLVIDAKFYESFCGVQHFLYVDEQDE